MVDTPQASFSLDMPPTPNHESISLNQDRRPNLTGTVWSARAHIITAVIGSRMLSLAWATAQLGWVGGAVVIVLFSAICCISSCLLASCYGTAATREINRNYSDAIKNTLGAVNLKFYGIIQYLNLFGMAVGYSIACAISLRGIMNPNRIRTSGSQTSDRMNVNKYIIAFGLAQMFISQIPELRDLPWISVISAVITLLYSFICIGLGMTNIIANGSIKGRLTVKRRAELVWWRSFEGLAEFASAFSCLNLIFEIQNTLTSPLSEDTMKKASIMTVGLTTLYVMLSGSVGYAALGEFSPTYLLTGVGFDCPYWIIDLANAAVVVHLLRDYQASSRPIFALIEKQALLLFPGSDFIARDVTISIRDFKLVSCNRFRLLSRTLFVIITTVTSMLFPLFNDVIGLFGGLCFWPLTVYFPVEIYMKQKNVVRWTPKWFYLQLFSLVSLVVSTAAVAGSVAGYVYDLKP